MGGIPEPPPDDHEAGMNHKTPLDHSFFTQDGVLVWLVILKPISTADGSGISYRTK